MSAAVRTQFPVFETKTYINSGSYGALCIDVENAFKEYLQTRLTQGTQWELWLEKLDYVRSHLSVLLVCQPDEIAITPSVSVSLNSIISALDFTSARNKVIITDFDFPTTSQLWLAQQQQEQILSGLKPMKTAAKSR